MRSFQLINYTQFNLLQILVRFLRVIFKKEGFQVELSHLCVSVTPINLTLTAVMRDKASSFAPLGAKFCFKTI